MKAANAKMEFIAYPDAVHSFTRPSARSDNSKRYAYTQKPTRNPGKPCKHSSRDYLKNKEQCWKEEGENTMDTADEHR